MDWIVWVKGLSRKPEVLAVARTTGRHRREVACILMEFWEWADEQTEDGTLLGVFTTDLCDLIQGTDEAFWLAVIGQRWLTQTKKGIGIPNFDRWMGRSAKKRLNKNRRQSAWRGGASPDEGNGGASVDALVDGQASTEAPTTEHNRREEINTNPLNPPSTEPEAAVEKPEPKAKAAADETASRIVEHYQATVQPAHPKARGVKNVKALLRRGLTEAALTGAADAYAARCSRDNCAAQFRFAVGNFYGQAATYEEYLGCQEKSAAVMTPEELAEYQERKRRELLDKPYCPG